MDATSCDVVPHHWENWHAIDWRTCYQRVRRLQNRIAKATQLGHHRQASRLQRLLQRSTSAKAVAVRRVTENRGRKTPGVDGITWSTPATKLEALKTLCPKGYRPKPLRRIHIPKPNGGKRPLGIPAMRDRAMQALYLLSVEPIAETQADPNSYGFRPERSTTDAIVQVSNALNRKHSPEWVLDADIQGCFDNISHDWMSANIPLDSVIVRRWLKAGFVEKGRLFPTRAGTPQGGVISPVLANLVLDGLEAGLKDLLPRRAKLNVIRYADDFVVTAADKATLTTKVIPWIRQFLKERGLTLSAKKTRVVHVTEGFDFLGWNVRKFGAHLMVSPSKANVKTFYWKIASLLRKLRGSSQTDVIEALTPVIRGWANYHRSQMASRTFAKLDHRIFQLLWRWAVRRHPNKGRRWIRRRYFQTINGRQWVFTDGHLTLLRLSQVTIRRHVKIKADANPHDPEWAEYFDKRKRDRMLQSIRGREELASIWRRQKGLCPTCQQLITRETGWDLHHRIWRSQGGSNDRGNLLLLHPNCHRQLHVAADAKPARNV